MTCFLLARNHYVLFNVSVTLCTHILVKSTKILVRFTENVTILKQVLKRLPGLKKLDGVPVEPEERESAKAA